MPDRTSPGGVRSTYLKNNGMQRQARQSQVVRWSIVSIALSFFLHIAPFCYSLLAPLYGLPDFLELDLESMNAYRDRIFRNPQFHLTPDLMHTPPALQVAVIPSQPDVKKRVSKPRKEEELERARAVQGAIQALWESMPAGQTGYALVSLYLQDDGSIGEYAINRLTGGEDFKAFLLVFLASLKASYGNQAGPGEPLWIECEFVVKPMSGKNKS